MVYESLFLLLATLVGVLSQSVDVSTNIGSPKGLASGVIYGMPLNDQLPQHL